MAFSFTLNIGGNQNGPPGFGGFGDLGGFGSAPGYGNGPGFGSAPGFGHGGGFGYGGGYGSGFGGMGRGVGYQTGVAPPPENMGGHWPSNSGPPPPSGSAYDVNGYGSFGGGMFGRQTSNPMVPGFTAPAVQQLHHQQWNNNQHHQQYGHQQHQQQHHQQYQQEQQSPPQKMPTSVMFQRADQGIKMKNNQAMQVDLYKQMGLLQEEEVRLPPKKPMMDYDDGVDLEEKEREREQWIKEYEESRMKAAEKAQQAAQKVSSDSDLKMQMKDLYVNELMRRQIVSGTFEITEGTVKPMRVYHEGDPVAIYHGEKGNNLVGQPWSCEYDCEYFRDAMKGLGTNEEAIINILAQRCNGQRQEMKNWYTAMYGRDIVDDINSELSGNFRETVMALFVEPPVYDAWSVKEAIYGPGTNEQALIEIFMTRTNAQLNEMKRIYPDMATPHRNNDANSLLDKDIIEDTNGDFKHLLRAAACAGRSEISQEQLSYAVEEMVINGNPTGMFQVNYDKLVDVEKCKREAKALYEAGEDRWGTDEDTFIRVFSIRNYYELRCIWNQYVKISQRDILNSIDRETSGDFKKGLAAIVMNIRCRPMYFAQRLRDCMKGLGTDDMDMIRIIVSRSEIDMVQIKQCFLELTHQTLWRWLNDDCSGDYKKLLQAIVGRD